VYIPVQVSSREGGRKSLYFLAPGEEVLAGIFVTSDGIALRYIKRLTGKDVPAQTGDAYSERITSRDGRPVFEGIGRLEVFDPTKGFGRLVIDRTADGRVLRVRRIDLWIFWSWIRIIIE
jgi:hypothetical protein